MAYISFQPNDYFNTKLYTGTGSSNAQTGVGFQPDWIWLKNRSSSANHFLVDAVRGITKELRSNSTNGEATDDQLITAFGSDGFTLGTSGSGNTNGDNYASWNWKANGQGSSNTDGTINTTYTSANTTSGMSIIKYSGNGSAGATIGHGLGVAPKCVIIKRTDTTSNWIFGTGARGFDKFLYLNDTAAETDNAGTFNDTAPSSSLITLGSWNDVNNSSGTYICYAFAEKKGFSKFGSYVGNGSVSGPFVYTGFKPAFVLVKNASAANNWFLQDSKRLGYNGANHLQKPNSNGADDTGTHIDMLSNGFKTIVSSANCNGSGNTMIYMAFAEHPLVASNGIPATAR